MKNIIKSFGFFAQDDSPSPYSYQPSEYRQTGDKEVSEAHKEYLKGLESEENNRLTLIENKTSQLIAQTGIIFSLLSLFVPILIDKVEELSFIIKLVLLLLLVISFCFYMLTIKNAIKNFNIKNFIYSKPSPNNVLKLQDKGLEIFYAEEVRDLLVCINQNLQTNNKKATNLLHSYNSFRVANMSTGILVVIFSFFLLFFTPENEKIIIEKPIKIENIDNFINKLSAALLSKKDTVYILSKDTIFQRKKQKVSTNSRKEKDFEE